MSLNLIKTYLVDKPGQKHLIWLDKWESQGFECSSGRLLNGRVKSNYILMGVNKEHFKVLLTKKQVFHSHALSGVCSLQERSWQVHLDLSHLLNMGSKSFMYFWFPITGTASHVKVVTGRFMVFGFSLLSLNTRHDMSSVMWPECKVELLVLKIHK